MLLKVKLVQVKSTHVLLLGDDQEVRLEYQLLGVQMIDMWWNRLEGSFIGMAC